MGVTPPEMRPDEQVLWSQAANRFQGRLRSVGGKLFITDRRLVFGPHDFDAALRGEQWSAPLSEIESVEVVGRLRLVHIHLTEGRRERFVLRPAEEHAAVIREAAQAAA